MDEDPPKGSVARTPKGGRKRDMRRRGLVELRVFPWENYKTLTSFESRVSRTPRMRDAMPTLPIYVHRTLRKTLKLGCRSTDGPVQTGGTTRREKLSKIVDVPKIAIL